MVFKIAVTILILMTIAIPCETLIAKKWYHSGRKKLGQTFIVVIKATFILFLLSIPAIILSCVWEI